MDQLIQFVDTHATGIGVLVAFLGLCYVWAHEK